MLIAGGTDILQLLQDSIVKPGALIDINNLPFAGINVDDSGTHIGALTRLADVADDDRIRQRYPLLAQALMETASPQIRNMATVGGNLLQRTRCLYFRDAASPCNKRMPGTGCPALVGRSRMNAIFGGSEHCIAAYPGDMAVALLALDAELLIQGQGRRRRMKLEELHRLPGDTPHIETTLEPGEIITAVLLPATTAARRSHYVKVRDRASFEWALVSAAVVLSMDGKVVQQARVTAGGVGTRPWRLEQAEQCLTGHVLDARHACNAGHAAGAGATPRSDNAFKVTMLGRAVERAVLAAGDLA